MNGRHQGIVKLNLVFVGSYLGLGRTIQAFVGKHLGLERTVLAVVGKHQHPVGLNQSLIFLKQDWND